MSVIAIYHGICPECEGPIMPGERIEAGESDDTWQHSDCTEMAARVDCVCERCFLVHAGECAW